MTQIPRTYIPSLGKNSDCIRKRIRQGLYGEIWPEPKGFAKGTSEGLDYFFFIYPEVDASYRHYTNPNNDLLSFNFFNITNISTKYCLIFTWTNTNLQFLKSGCRYKLLLTTSLVCNSNTTILLSRDSVARWKEVTVNKSFLGKKNNEQYVDKFNAMWDGENLQDI